MPRQKGRARRDIPRQRRTSHRNRLNTMSLNGRGPTTCGLTRLGTRKATVGQRTPSTPTIETGTTSAVTGHMPLLVAMKTSTLVRALSGYVALLPASIAGHRLAPVPDLAAYPSNHKGPVGWGMSRPFSPGYLCGHPRGQPTSGKKCP